MRNIICTNLFLVIASMCCLAEHALACDYSLSGEVSFASFQNTLSNATYVDIEPGIKICLAPGTQIVNAPNSTTQALVVNKDDIQIVGSPSAPATIVNRRTTAGLWQHTALHFNGKRDGVLENLVIQTEGDYGIGIFVDGAHLKSLKNIKVISTGSYSPQLRVQSSVSSSANVATIDSIQQVKLETSGPNQSSPFTTVSRARFGYISGLDIEMLGSPTYSPPAIQLYGSEIKSIRNFTIKNSGHYGIMVNSGSSIGFIEAGTIVGKGATGTAIGIFQSSVGYLADVSYSNLSYTGNSPFFFSTAEIGSISKVSSTSGASTPQAFFLSGTLVGTSYCLTANGVNATNTLNQSSIKYDIPCPSTKSGIRLQF